MDIERLIKCDLPSRLVAGFEPDPRIKAEPIVDGRNRVSRGRNSTRSSSKSVKHQKVMTQRLKELVHRKLPK